MRLELLNGIHDLKNEILKSEEYLIFKEAEKELESNDEVAILSYKKDMAILEYEDTLKHYAKSSNESLRAKKFLDDAILKLNSHNVVKKYNEALTKLNLLLSEIEETIMGDIK